MVEQKLFKTRLCNLHQRGGCHRQNCSFAHGEAELRRFLHGSREDHRGGDLREKLDRRRSPVRSYSPERDRRGRRESYGDSPRSPIRDIRDVRDVKHRRKQPGDVHSDGSLRASEGTEDKVRDLRRASSESKEFLDEQLRKLQSETILLDEHKHRLENYLDERIKEAGSLTTKIHDLELQLSHEKEESRRISSKIKKFVKAYNRQSRLEDELKRSRADFERVCEQLGLDSYRLVDEVDHGFDLSDEEADNLKNQKNELQTNDSLSRKRPRVHTEVNELSLQAANPYKGEIVAGRKERMEKSSRWNPLASSSTIKKSDATNGIAKHVMRTVVEEHKSNSSTKHASSDIAMMASKGRVSEPAVLFPSTSMAARVVDDFVDIVDAEEKIEMARTPPSGVDNDVAVSKFPALPLPPPPPLPFPVNTYAEYKGDDENVDIDGGGAEEETMEVDIV